MSFALPLALLVGLLVAGPIIAHVVRRSETKERPLPTFHLLAMALAESQKRRRLDDRALFALRLLAVALAALAAAAPFVRVPLEFGDGRACALAIVIDGSRSMLARSGTTPLVDLARERAARAAAELPEGSEVTIVLATDPIRTLVDRSTTPETAARAVEGISAAEALGGDTLAAAVRVGVRRLHGARHAVRRLIVYSDFAAHVDSARIVVPSGVTADFVRLSPSSRENAAAVVESVRLDDSDPEVRVVRAGITAERLDASARIRLDVDGRTVAQGEARASSPPTPVELRASGVREALAVAELSADVDDALPEDDAVRFLLRAPSSTRVLLVDGEPATDRFEDEVGLAARALDLAPSDDRRFEVTRVDAGGLTEESLGRADVVVLANVDDLEPAVAEALASRIQAGLGLLVAPADRSDGAALTRRLAALLPARIGLHAPCPERAGVVLRDLPEGLTATGLGGTVHRRCTELEPNLARGRVALTREDGSALLVLGEVQRGRVAVLGTSLDTEDSDLPLRPGFLPFLVSLVGHLDASASSSADRVLVGSTMILRGRGLRLRAPDGTVHEPDQDGRFGPFDALGPWIVTRDGEPDPDASFTVIAPERESDLREGTLPASSRLAAENTRGGTLRRDVAPPFFALLGLVILAEGFLRDRQRGSLTASTTRSTPP